MSPLQIFLILGTFVFLMIIVYYLMKSRLELKYTLIWFVFAVILLLLAIFPEIATCVAKWVGIATPINAIYIFAFVFALLIILSLTIIVSLQSKQIKQLAQKLALLENRVGKLEDK